MEYSEFLGDLEPFTLALNSSSFSLDRDAYWDDANVARRLLSSKYKLVRSGGNYFDVEASFTVVLQPAADTEGPAKQALRIECVFYGHFHVVKPLNVEHAKRFAESDSWLVFWPYFRQFVSDTTSRMAIPPLAIPLALGPGDHSHRRRAKSKGKADSGLLEKPPKNSPRRLHKTDSE